MRVSVLRLGHRFVRDDRVTTHIALVTRAMGGDRIFMTEVDDSIKSTMAAVIQGWGGKEFEIEIVQNWRSVIDHWKNIGGKIVHLTMYGINIDNIIDRIRGCENLLVVVGAEKVPREMYDTSDYNVAIGNQPHSEIAALAVCMDRIFNGKELMKKFDDAKIEIVPSPNGKKVLKKVSD
jgi:tRNA (cytidine56-2'-O)-methyltransferase